MTGVGEMLASAVVKGVGAKLVSAIGDQIMLQLSFRKDLEGIKETLDSVEAMLKDAERRSTGEESVRLWLKRLKNAAYDISDMIDEFQATPTATTMPEMLQKVTAASRRFPMANKIKKMRERLEKISEEHKSFSFSSGAIFNVQQFTDPRTLSASMFNEAEIVGRDEEKRKIIALLSACDIREETVILPIYGLGGIGKTTLAQMVFYDTRFKCYSRAWVYVSQAFDLNKIRNSIVSQISEGSNQNSNGTELIDGSLDGRKILIVLDDLWEDNQFKLKELKNMLNVGKKGGNVNVVVTTRTEDIAKKICTDEPYMLRPLEHGMCWTIIKHSSAFEARADKEQLEQIGMDIAKKCEGVALAAQALGYMLQFRNTDEWLAVSKSEVWNEHPSEDTSLPHNIVLPSLKLSYYSMLPYLRLCFAYCAIFPKGHNIVKDNLIHQWISLGFIEPSNTFSSRQLGENYVRQLLGMSFLQHSKSSLTSRRHDKDVMLFTMHDLVHNVARSVMDDELVILDARKESRFGENTYRYALLTNFDKSLKKLSTILPANLRVLHFLGCSKMELSGEAFSSAKCLRILDLSECCVQKLPDSVSQLKQLRYLNAPGVQDRMIPKTITKLSKLSYLNLCGSSELLKLPESIGKLEGLTHLDISGCFQIEELPESVGELKRLVHLDLSNCFRVANVSKSLGNLTNLQYLDLSYCSNLGELAGALGKLMELQSLNLSYISNLRGLPQVLGSLTKLQYLNLSSRFSYLGNLPEAFGSLTQLKYLNLSGCGGIEELPKSFQNLKNLVHLDLSDCSCVERIPETLRGLTKLHYLNLSHYCGPENKHLLHLTGLPEALDHLTELQYLNLSMCLDPIFCNLPPDESQRYVECISALPNLEHLDLSKNCHLCSLPESLGSLKKLHALDLSGCTFLRGLPESIVEIDRLKFLNVTDCLKLEMPMPRFMSNNNSFFSPQFRVRAGDGEIYSNLVQLRDENPAELEIICLENVKSIKEAQMIKLVEKEKLQKLTLDWTRHEEQFEDTNMLRELVPPKSLERFKLRGYNSASFPAWLMGIAPYLPNLVEIKMEDLPRCSILPPLGQLPNLRELVLRRMPSITKITGDFCGGKRSFPRLEEFILENMERLKEWSTTYNGVEDGVQEWMFPNLQKLYTIHCPKLRLNPCPPRALEWKITRSDNVITSWGKRGHTPMGTSSSASPVTTLEIQHCKVPLDQWKLLHHLPCLPNLRIYECDDLTCSSPEMFWGLSSPQSLSMGYLHFVELPRWLGSLTFIQKLVINSCSELKSLQESIRHLPSLQSLLLLCCDSLTSLPEWLGELTSLQELGIDTCRQLESLPESTRHLAYLQSLDLGLCEGMSALPEWLGDLTSLQRLEIRGCPGIKSLPQSIQQLTNLQVLHIYSCPELKRWCDLEENKMKLKNINEKDISS